MASLYDLWKRKHKEVVEDLGKWPEMPNGSSVVRRLRGASERAHQKRRKIWERIRNGKHGKNL